MKKLQKPEIWTLLSMALSVVIFVGVPACNKEPNNHKCYSRRNCYSHGQETKYPIVNYMRHGSETYLNDSIVVIRTRIKGLDNYETTIVNLRNNK